MKRIFAGLLATLLLLLIAAACSDGSSGDAVDSADDLTGPALVLFFTEN